jgi:hypothetical protein
MTMLAVLLPESSLAVASRVSLFGVLMPKGEKCSSRIAACVFTFRTIYVVLC